MTLSAEQFRRIEELYHRLEGASDESILQELREVATTEPAVAEAAAALLTSTANTTGSAFSALARDAQQLLARTELTPSPTPDDAAASELPAHIGRYRIVRLLGEGGMGQVFEAEQLEPVHRSVAIKVIRRHLDSDEVLARFRAEQQALAVMNHNHIARVLDADITEDGRPYFVMELVPGVPITRYCDTHELSIEQRIELFEDVLSAVQHAHQKGIIHRDLKPSNILVAAPSSSEAVDDQTTDVLRGAGSGSGSWARERRPIVKVIDFGIAKATETSLLGDSEATRVGDLVGTPEYMSPEQASLGELDVDVRSDVYSLGLVLYELLTGILPVSGQELRAEGFDAMRRIIREREVPRASERVDTLTRTNRNATADTATRRRLDPDTLRRRLRGDLDWILLRALDKERTRRYDSVASFAADLRRHLDDEPVSAGPPTVRYRLSKFVRRNRLAVAGASLLALALLIGLTGATLGLVSARRSAEEAQKARTLADQQAQAAERTAQFLGRLFRSADPRERAGEDITVDEILGEGVEQIDRLEDEPATQLRLLGLFGNVYTARGEFDTAEPILRRLMAFEADEALVPREAQERERLNATSALGSIQRDRGELELAERTIREGLEFARGQVEPTDDAWGAAANNLGTILRQLERYDEAETWYREALIAVEANEQPPGPNTGTIYNNLSAIAMRRSDYAGGEELNRRAIELFASRLPPLHPAFGTLFMNRSVALRNIGELPRAIAAAERAVEITRRSLGEEHFALGSALLNLAWVQEAFGQYEQAEGSLRRGIDVMNQSVGLVGVTGIGLTTRLAMVLAAQGRLDEALRYYEQRFALSDAEGPSHDQATAIARLDLAHWLRQDGALDEAQRQIDLAVESARRLDDSSTLAWALLGRAHLLLAQGQPAAAQAAFADAEDVGGCSPDSSCFLDDVGSRFFRASFHALAGRDDSADSALQHLEFCYQQRHRRLDALDSPDFDRLREQPAFQQAARDWRVRVETGDPDLPDLELPASFD